MQSHPYCIRTKLAFCPKCCGYDTAAGSCLFTYYFSDLTVRSQKSGLILEVHIQFVINLSGLWGLCHSNCSSQQLPFPDLQAFVGECMCCYFKTSGLFLALATGWLAICRWQEVELQHWCKSFTKKEADHCRLPPACFFSPGLSQNTDVSKDPMLHLVYCVYASNLFPDQGSSPKSSQCLFSPHRQATYLFPPLAVSLCRRRGRQHWHGISRYRLDCPTTGAGHREGLVRCPWSDIAWR